MKAINPSERLPDMNVEVFALVSGFLMEEPRKAIITRKVEDGFYCVGSDFFFTTDKEGIIEWYEC